MSDDTPLLPVVIDFLAEALLYRFFSAKFFRPPPRGDGSRLVEVIKLDGLVHSFEKATAFLVVSSTGNSANAIASA